MKLVGQSFCFEDEGFEDKNFKAIPEIDKERLKIIFFLHCRGTWIILL